MSPPCQRYEFGCKNSLAVLFVLFASWVAASNLVAQPRLLGDLDSDVRPTVLDLQRLINHVNGSNLLSSALLPYGDLNEDGFVNANDVRLLQDAILGLAPLPDPYSPPLITTAVTATNGSIITLSGVARPNRQILVTGGRFAVFGVSDTNGSFSVSVNLRPNQLNNLFVTASSSNFVSGIPQPFRVLQDSQPPNLYIDFPTNGQTLYTSNTVVAGRVGDMLSGFMGLSVGTRSTASVEFFPANVNVGIGNNGTFERSLVPLAEGTNEITVTATDAHGNSTFRVIRVYRGPLSGPRLELVSGDLQATNVHRRLAEPIVVRALQANDAPFANKLVTLEVTRSDGRLRPVDASSAANPSALTNDITRTVHGVMSLELFTDANGEARAWWAMGGDAGHGNNRVCVMSAGISNAVYFCASARPAAASQINIGMGNNQKAETGAFVSEPLRAWVNDSCNGIEGLPVTFTIIQGGGKLFTDQQLTTSNQQSAITVPTTRTGHAEALLQLGADEGQNIITATYPGNPGLPATFIAHGVARDPSQPTRLSGLVLDNASCPIGGTVCSVSVSGQMFFTTTDAQGRFHFTNTPAGPAQLRVDGSTATNLLGATIPTNSFPSLEFPLILIPNAENSLPGPVLLPRLNLTNQRLYYGTNDLVLTCEDMEGLKMTIKANSMRKPDGTLVTPANPATVSLNQVHHDDVPMPIPDGASPPFAWTLQPGGATFDPPIQIAYPNMSGLPAGTVAYFLSYNHDTRRFEIIATGHVQDNSATIVTDAGAGLSLAGWGCNCPPYSVAGDCESDDSDEDNCSAAGIAARIAALIAVAEGFRALPPVIFSEFAEDHLTHFLFGDGEPIDYYDGSSAAAMIQAESVFEESHEELLADLRVRVLSAMENGDSTVSQYYQSRPALSFYSPTFGKVPVDQLSAGIGALSEPFDAAVGPVTIADGRFTGEVLYAMRDHYRFDAADCSFGGFDGMACYLQKCGSAHGFFVNIYFSVSIDEPVPSALPSPLPQAALPQAIPTSSVASSEPNLVLGYSLGEEWSLQINGQTAIPAANGRFAVRNIAAADLFGVGGPGTPPDFVSDDFVRLIGTSQVGGRTIYVFSQPFPITGGDQPRAKLGGLDLTFTATPPLLPESIQARPDQIALTALGQTTHLRVIARLRGGANSDVTARTKWTTYRTSNPAIATIDPDGVVTARAPGRVFVTAVNGGATAVANLIVVLDDPLTIVEGTVRRSDGSAAAGATVTVGGLGGAVTDADGRFSITNVPTTLGPLTVAAQLADGSVRYIAKSSAVTPVPGDVTDAGILILMPAPTTVPIAAGARHSVSLRTDGSLWAWGDNGQAQLGDGTTTDRLNPVRIGTNNHWVAATAGDQHTVALQSDGSLWAWGDNSQGQLGDTTLTDRPNPVRIGVDNDWVIVVAGDLHTLAVKGDGTLWTWGDNAQGQLGDGTTLDKPGPVPVNLPAASRVIAGGTSHSLALLSDGSLWAWGDNSYGQIGDGTLTDRPLPVRVGSENDWAALVAGSYHTVALRNDGSLWAWGRNDTGALGDGTTARKPSPVRVGTENDWGTIAAGDFHSIATKIDGRLWAWGNNFSSQVGDGSASNRLAPVRIGTESTWAAVEGGGVHALGLQSDGVLRAWGGNTEGQLGNGTREPTHVAPVPVGNATDWIAIGAGFFHTVALKTAGSLWTWGDNANGQLGNGTLSDQFVPVQIGTDLDWSTVSASAATFALKTNGSLWAWGDNTNGRLGDGTTADRPAPVRIGLSNDWVTVVAGDGHTVALKTDGSLWAWGENGSGQLGDGTATDRFSPVRIGNDSDWLAVAPGNNHTIALKTDRSLWAWGANHQGQLGDGTGTNRSSPVRIGAANDWSSIAAGVFYSVAVKTGGTLWAWGDNGQGQLGDSTTGDKSSPVQIGIVQTWATVATGNTHTLAVRTDGSLWAWGDNTQGQLGLGSTTDRTSPARVGTANDWSAVAAGTFHTLGLKSDGRLLSWGNNGQGQLGLWSIIVVPGSPGWGFSP